MKINIILIWKVLAAISPCVYNILTYEIYTT